MELAPGVTMYPGVILEGRTRIGNDTTLGPGVLLKDVEVGEGANLKAGSVAEDSERRRSGPARALRSSAAGVGRGGRQDRKFRRAQEGVDRRTHERGAPLVPGRRDVGKQVNIGCGFVTCNFDGRVIDGNRKHRTIIEDDVVHGQRLPDGRSGPDRAGSLCRFGLDGHARTSSPRRWPSPAAARSTSPVTLASSRSPRRAAPQSRWNSKHPNCSRNTPIECHAGFVSKPCTLVRRNAKCAES